MTNFMSSPRCPALNLNVTTTQTDAQICSQQSAFVEMTYALKPIFWETSDLLE